MAEEVQANKQWLDTKFLKWMWMDGLISGIGKQILWRLVGMPRPLAFLLSQLLALLVTYRYFPYKNLNFIDYAIGFSSVMIGGTITLYIAIPFLEGFLPAVPAYGIPLVLYGILLFYVFKFIRQSSRQKNS
jgi:hypothetical protein